MRQLRARGGIAGQSGLSQDTREGTRSVHISAVVAEALLSGRADAIIAADRAGIIRFWNPSGERLTIFVDRWHGKKITIPVDSKFAKPVILH